MSENTKNSERKNITSRKKSYLISATRKHNSRGMQIVQIEQAPKDYISDIKIIPSKSLLLITSWDGSLTVYKFDIQAKNVDLYNRYDINIRYCAAISSTIPICKYTWELYRVKF